MRDKTLVNIRHSLCQKQNPVERPAETIDAISSLRPIFWQKAAKLFDNPHLRLRRALQATQCADRFHLLKNLGEAVEDLLARHLSASRKHRVEVALEEQTPAWLP